MKNAFLREKAYINGKWVDSEKGETFDVLNPATLEKIGVAQNVSTKQVQQAIDSAEIAFRKWKKTSPRERCEKLRKLNDLMIKHQDELGRLLTLEMGKPFAEGRGEILYGASYIEWYAEEAKRVYGDTILSNQPNQKMYVQKEPIGVCAAITPWNFPQAMLTRKLAPALAVGCTMVAKPDSNTPYSALAIAALAEEAEIPAGVFNVVTGDPARIGETLMASKVVKKVSFTGSTRVGKLLIQQSADTVKKLTMELGGNAPFIVFDDADLDKAVEGTIHAKFRNAGQTCVCANRIFVHSKIAKEFVTRLAEKVSAMKVGNGFEKGVVIGPLINEFARNKVQELLADAVQSGAKIVVGGKSVDGKGYFFQPTLVCDVSTKMRIFNEEIFGPILSVITFDKDEDVIQMSNATDYGLAAYFYSQNVSRIMSVSDALEFGMVGVNTSIVSAVQAPFGGIKQSGWGREGSRYGIDDYLTLKYVNLNY